MDWVKVGTDLGVGGAVGVADQMVQNWDDKREKEKGAKLTIMRRAGTYVNYGVPLLSVVASALGYLKGEWMTRAVLLGGELAGRKATWDVTKRDRVVTYQVWSREAPRVAPTRTMTPAGGGGGSTLEF